MHSVVPSVRSVVPRGSVHRVCEREIFYGRDRDPARERKSKCGAKRWQVAVWRYGREMQKRARAGRDREKANVGMRDRDNSRQNSHVGYSRQNLAGSGGGTNVSPNLIEGVGQFPGASHKFSKVSIFYANLLYEALSADF